MGEGPSRIGRAIRRIIPAPLKPALRRARAAVTGVQPSPPEAPQAMWGLVGDPDADFAQTAANFMRFFLECGLKPDAAVLDVGCGIGRAAAPLMGYLNEKGLYRGFDVIPEAIDWCNANIAAVDRRFAFFRPDLHSASYNPQGRLRSRDYVFPYPDATFDFVWLGSVFTHMLSADQARFMAEIARVTRPGGTTAISFYLLDQAARANRGLGVCAFEFDTELGGCWTADPANPEWVIGYDIEPILAQYEAHGFDIVERRMGLWRERPEQDQDIIVARKR